jgi:putative transposase
MGNALMSTTPSKKSPSYASRGITPHECQTGLVDKVTRTFRLKVKREAYPWLNAAAFEVNQVWNWCNERSCSVFGNTGRRLSGFDLVNAASGSTAYFDKIGADIISRVCTQYADKRKASKLPKLKWRHSFGPRRSLGWMPFRGRDLKRHGNSLRLIGKSFRVFDREYLGDHKFRDGCFAQDACGDWWLCVPVECATESVAAASDAVGVDLGLKTIATTSDGETLEAGRWTHAYAERLANAQRRGHKRQAKRIHRKTARCRADALHKFSTSLVNRYQRIYVGDVSSTKLVKTRMAKSVLDSGWGMLRTQFEYKCQQAAREFQVVNESYTTRACSSCGALTGPAGLDMLAVRQFVCDACGEAHERDVNAARNILTVGLRYRASVCGNEPSWHEYRLCERVIS